MKNFPLLFNPSRFDCFLHRNIKIEQILNLKLQFFIFIFHAFLMKISHKLYLVPLKAKKKSREKKKIHLGFIYFQFTYTFPLSSHTCWHCHPIALFRISTDTYLFIHLFISLSFYLFFPFFHFSFPFLSVFCPSSAYTLFLSLILIAIATVVTTVCC